MDSVHLDQDMNQWWALVNMAMNCVNRVLPEKLIVSKIFNKFQAICGT
jgi:hypothetical protein